MFISEAYAVEATANLAEAPDALETMLLNIGFIGLLIAMFWFLMIRPQQKRIKEHSDMLSTLGKGVAVVTQGGIIGEIDKIVDDKIVRLDLGEGVKVKVLRSTISAKLEDFVPLKGSAKEDK